MTTVGGWKVVGNWKLEIMHMQADEVMYALGRCSYQAVIISYEEKYPCLLGSQTPTIERCHSTYYIPHIFNAVCNPTLHMYDRRSAQ